jgi:hypothetical protein
MTGCLIDSEQCESVIDTLWTYLRQNNLHGLSFPMFPVDSPLGHLLKNRCEKSKTTSIVDDLCLRATVTPTDASAMSSKRATSLRRGRRALEKIGQVSLRFDHCSTDDLSAVERFLFLESLGWKGESQSAIACRMSARLLDPAALTTTWREKNAGSPGTAVWPSVNACREWVRAVPVFTISQRSTDP